MKFKTFVRKYGLFAAIIVVLAIAILPSEPVSDILVAVPLFVAFGAKNYLYICITLVVLLLLIFHKNIMKILKGLIEYSPT